MNARIGGAKMYDGLLDAMRAAGLEFRGSIVWNSNKAERYLPDGDEKSSSKHAWYLAHDDERGVCVTFGSWRDGSQHTWAPAGQKRREISDEERQRIESAKREADAERKAAHEVARRKAVKLWESLPTSGESPYLKRKNVASFGLRYAVNILRESFGWDPGGPLTGVVVPGYKIKDDGTLIIQTLQIIFGDGGKFFFRGAEQKGACHIIGALSPDTKRILLCEGYSTGATLHESTGMPVVCAFNAGNVVAVAKTLRKRFPSAMLTVCGDDDRWHEPGAKNAGREAAFDAVAETGCGWVLPTFPDGVEGEPTDFNDLAALFGNKEVHRQVMGEKDRVQDDRVKIVIKKAEHEGDDDVELVYVDDIDHVAKNLVLVYGADVVWDDANREMLKVSQAKEYYPQSYKLWRLMGSGRRVVKFKNVVFEPQYVGHRPGTVNLFDGIKMRPKKGGCSLICDLLNVLCGRDAEILHWVTCWLAYPLQNVGAKMHTCLVFHGKTQGTGKNVFFEHVMSKIYGQWGRVINQHQLESQYTDWLSKKLYIVGNEIAPPKDLGKLRGPMKQMISDDTIEIEQKFHDTRTEKNHVNIVFLSNSAVPVPIEADDRRYMTVRIEEKMTDDYYRAVVDQTKSGGCEAFYQYLLDYDVGGFVPSTKPISTEDRAALMHAAKTPAVRFIEDWLGGHTYFPVIPAPAPFLYDAYRRWCTDAGERSTSNVHFARQVADEVPKSDVRFDIPQFCVTESGYIDEIVGKTVRTHIYIPPSFRDAVTPSVVRAAAVDWADKLLADAAMKKRMRS